MFDSCLRITSFFLINLLFFVNYQDRFSLDQDSEFLVYFTILIKYEYPIIRAVCSTRDSDTCKKNPPGKGGLMYAPPLQKYPPKLVYRILKGMNNIW